jgi:hypothetical protein
MSILSGRDNNPFKVEVTPKMIAAGVVFLKNEALNCFSQRAVSDDFALEFYLAMETERLRDALVRDGRKTRVSTRRPR